MFKCPLGDCVSKENTAYVGLTTTTLSRWLTMHLNDSSSKALHLKEHSIPKSKFRRILVENITIIAQIDKLRLQILEALHIKTTKPKINRINFENSDVLKCFLYTFFSWILSSYFISVDSVPFLKYISYPVFIQLCVHIFLLCYKRLSKTFKTHFKKQHTLHKQATPDDGLWRV